MNTDSWDELRVSLGQRLGIFLPSIYLFLLSFFGAWPLLGLAAKVPDFGHMLSPEEVNTPVFTLNQDYPQTLVEIPEDVSNLLKMNVVETPDRYLEQLAQYVRLQLANALALPKNVVEGMTKVSATTDADWYHAPWLHWGAEGREGFNGLVRMSPIPAAHLSSVQAKTSAYSLSLYNGRAAWVFAQVWPEKEPPNLSIFQTSSGFPVGSVMLKTLWVPLDEHQVPSLHAGIRKTAFIVAEDVPGVKASYPGQRLVTEVRLLEVDVMVRDSRVDASGGWVFASLQYDGEGQSGSAVDHLKPIGLMWGNDPGQYQAALLPQGVSPQLKQSFMVSVDQRPLPNGGWGGRLSSVVYDQDTSCQSCHVTAQYPQLSTFTPGLEPPDAVEQAPLAWMKWFKNYPRGVAFDPGQALSLDYSQGLLRGFQNYSAFVDLYYQGRYAAQYPLTTSVKNFRQDTGSSSNQATMSNQSTLMDAEQVMDDTQPEVKATDPVDESNTKVSVRVQHQTIQTVKTDPRDEREGNGASSAAPGIVWQALKARLQKNSTEASGSSSAGEVLDSQTASQGAQP